MQLTISLRLALLAAAFAGPASAQLALDFPAGSAVTYVPATAGMYGWSLAVDAPVLLTGLAYWDHAADGLLESHEVGIWVRNGPLLASAVVPAGTSASLLGEFRVVDVAPLLLAPGQYVLAGHDRFRDDPVGQLPPVNLGYTTFPGVQFGAAHFEDSDTFTYPNEAMEMLGLFGGNAVLAPTGGAAVPEPSAYSLLGAVGMGGLIVVRRWRRR